MTIHDDMGEHYGALAARLNELGGSLTLDPPAWPVLPHGDGPRAEWRAAEGEHRHLFAHEPYFVSRRQVTRMAELIRAVESVVALPAYREHALARADDIARLDHGPLSVFFGYDFHLGDAGPRLIEINTNAGGALLNTAMAKARACRVDASQSATLRNTVDPTENGFVEAFREEWRRQRGDAPLARIAIVDTDPHAQYLAPEFRLFENLFRAHGLSAVVADPSEFELRDRRLWCRGAPVDLVYNRLTDFTLAQPAHAALRAAYVGGHVVLTPHPRAHALYADKRALTLLSDDALLRSWGVAPSVRAVLESGIPRTLMVTEETGDALWSERRRLFFKPASGYGSKGAYRGDKLTRRVWREIVTGNYVAQEFAPPGVRRACVDGKPVELKVDVRNYVYAGRVQLLVARMFQGQTTNFRTPGGGFAPVVEVDDSKLAVLAARRRPERHLDPVESLAAFSVGGPLVQA